MNQHINRLKVLRSLAKDELFLAITELCVNKREDLLNDYYAALYAVGAERGVRNYVQKLVLYDKNPYSVACAYGTESKELTEAFISDLTLINNLLDDLAKLCKNDLGKGLPIFCDGNAERAAAKLKRFYRKNGYGDYAAYKAFSLIGGKLCPIDTPPKTTFDMLKGYAAEKTAVINNISDFINGLPYRHMLLYGDRGTGKSSTIHAALNAFCDKGLRLIEIGNGDINSIGEIKKSVSRLPLKFLLFCDDLSVSDEGSSALLRAAIEGTLIGSENTMVVATSNKRHIIAESFNDREHSLHPSDVMQEQLALSDRFGLTVIFSSCDKNSYLSMIRELAADKKLEIDGKLLATLAERWAIVNGGRSPRHAEQFVNYVYSCKKSGRAITF